MIADPGKHEAAPNSGASPPQRCRNCGHEIRHSYCPKCGQHSKDHNQGLWQFIAEFFEEFVRLDSKFLRTLVPLIIRPGFLTREWVEGKRVRYITPLKLYISLSAIFFLVLTAFPNTTIIHTGSIDEHSSAEARKSLLEGKSRSPWIATIINEQVAKLVASGERGDLARKEFSEKFIGRLSTANLILLPIFALLFKCLYIRRSRFYVEHLVFALHDYAFFSLALTIVMLVFKLPSGLKVLAMPVCVWMVAYLPIAMFVNYQQGFFKTLVKCWIFLSVYFFAVSFVLLGMLVWAAHDTADPLAGVSSAASSQSKALSPDQGHSRTIAPPKAP